MKFLARRSDGSIIGRFEDSNLTFPIPADAVVYDSPVDISETVLPDGSSAADFLMQKREAFRTLHPTFIYSFNNSDELLTANCDTTHSTLVTAGPGKTTQIRPGGTLVTNVVTCSSTIKVCAYFTTYHIYEVGGLRYYNFDPSTGLIYSGPSITAQLVDPTTPATPIITIQSGVESGSTSFTNFRFAFTNSLSDPVYLSGWSLISWHA